MWGVRAVACGPGTRAVDCSIQRQGPFEWEILQEGKDYYVDPTGTWFALANRLDQSDYLAVSYVTASGTDSIGTIPVDASRDTAKVDTLRWFTTPKPSVNAASPTFRFEIRSAYRVGGREIDRTSVELALSVNQARTQCRRRYLPAAVESRAGERRDEVRQYNRLFPAPAIRTRAIRCATCSSCFRTSRRSPIRRSSPRRKRNDSLYRTPRVYLATQGPPVGLRAAPARTGDRLRRPVAAVAEQLPDPRGSERIYVGNRLLTREQDYSIDYTTGQLQFRNPDALFQGGVSQVRAQFEERAAFALAPTTTYGLSAR